MTQSVHDYMAQPSLNHEPTDPPSKPHRYVSKSEFYDAAFSWGVAVEFGEDGCYIELANEVIVYAGEVAS